ncbi:hypothetical protein CDD82_6482 [Ophiocordyceps australis]|uniref:Rho-GAP domain-containing protein n=1 Tax=Ophiocordyceps australis TaxID=1399860 RepID=A0A2C5YVX6_9HYPO|nr:hypothetical protein CDD82_6482 [Ophiocordyceps australis]
MSSSAAARAMSSAVAPPASPPTRRDLKSWWKSFKQATKHHEPRVADVGRPPSPPLQENKAPGIFGVPLRQSITYANVAISLINENGVSYTYGYVPIVVAKCGVFLKEKATSVEGIFRLSGSEKRIRDLKSIFDSPDRYGKGLVWDGYTVHDAANVLRRYLNDLPEPVVPLDLYEKFRDPLRGSTKPTVNDAEGPQFVDDFDSRAAIVRYQKLITELPPLNRQLLLYILDLLAVFAAKSDENRMTAQNLAAIFQPGMLSHPSHAMAPEEYRLNQCALIFLIENQDNFLIGMQGTAADEQMVQEVESGTPTGPLTPMMNRCALDRSDSTASAGAASVRRDGKVRRNRSISSWHSRQDGAATPNSPSLAATPTGGLGRSNTVPSKKSPALAAAQFKNDSPGQQSPSASVVAYVQPMTPVRPANTESRSPHLTLAPVPFVGGASLIAEHVTTPSGLSQERLLDVPHDTPATPQTKERNLQSLFQRSPGDGGEKRQPNKLRKKRIPGSLNISAQSSSASLTRSITASPAAEVSNPMDVIPPMSASQPSPQFASHQASPSSLSQPAAHACDAQTSPLTLAADAPTRSLPVKPMVDVPPEATPRASNTASPRKLHSSDQQNKSSPATSANSSFNYGSDVDQTADEQLAPRTGHSDKEKKRRWRLSRSKQKDDYGGSSSSVAAPHGNIVSNDKAERSTTSIGSAASKLQNGYPNDGSEPTTAGSTEGLGGHEAAKENHTRDESRGPFGWIKNKYREAKENAEQRRTKSPPADRHPVGASLVPRGKSIDVKQERHEDNKNLDKDVMGHKDRLVESRKEMPDETVPASLLPAPTGSPTTTSPPTVSPVNEVVDQETKYEVDDLEPSVRAAQSLLEALPEHIGVPTTGMPVQPDVVKQA